MLQRRAAAKECANIYAPLANRLGIGQLKWEIEDYAFRYQQPDTYNRLLNSCRAWYCARTIHNRLLTIFHRRNEPLRHQC